MKGIIADINIQGHVDLLVVLMQAEPWKLFWDYLHVRYVHFTDVGLLSWALIPNWFLPCLIAYAFSVALSRTYWL